MLTREQIYDLAEKNNLQLLNHWASVSEGRALPELNKITLFFPRTPVPDAWFTLMTELSEVPVEVRGTRPEVHDGLAEAYKERLPEVNSRRAEIGLTPVFP